MGDERWDGEDASTKAREGFANRTFAAAHRLRLHGAATDQGLQGPHHLGQGHSFARKLGNGSQQVQDQPPRKELRSRRPRRASLIPPSCLAVGTALTILFRPLPRLPSCR